MTGIGETSGEGLDLALACGLLRRWGPTPAQLAALPWWRRTVCRLLPRRQRWRVHPMAPLIRDRDIRSARTASATPACAGRLDSRVERLLPPIGPL